LLGARETQVRRHRGHLAGTWPAACAEIISHFIGESFRYPEDDRVLEQIMSTRSGAE
jgi:hypothetical protein